MAWVPHAASMFQCWPVEMAPRFTAWFLTASRSSSVSSSGRPFLNPSQDLYVRPVQAKTTFSPARLSWARMFSCRPRPKAMRRPSASVPQVMPKTVRSVLSLWLRASTRSCWMAILRASSIPAF